MHHISPVAITLPYCMEHGANDIFSKKMNQVLNSSFLLVLATETISFCPTRLLVDYDNCSDTLEVLSPGDW